MHALPVQLNVISTINFEIKRCTFSLFIPNSALFYWTIKSDIFAILLVFNSEFISEFVLFQKVFIDCSV